MTIEQRVPTILVTILIRLGASTKFQLTYKVFVDSLDYEGNRLGLSGYVKNHNNYNYLYKYLQVQWINKIE